MGFKQQIVQEVESGLMSLNAASRKYQISSSVIDRWRRKARQEGSRPIPRFASELWSGRTGELKEKLAELYLEVQHFKKLEDWIRRQRSANTSVMTAENLARIQREPNHETGAEQ